MLTLRLIDHLDYIQAICLANLRQLNHNFFNLQIICQVFSQISLLDKIVNSLQAIFILENCLNLWFLILIKLFSIVFFHHLEIGLILSTIIQIINQQTTYRIGYYIFLIQAIFLAHDTKQLQLFLYLIN